MFIIEKNSMELMLPITDEEIRQLYHENWQTLFLPVKSAHCLCAKIDNFAQGCSFDAQIQFWTGGGYLGGKNNMEGDRGRHRDERHLGAGK